MDLPEFLPVLGLQFWVIDVKIPQLRLINPFPTAKRSRR